MTGLFEDHREDVAAAVVSGLGTFNPERDDLAAQAARAAAGADLSWLEDVVAPAEAAMTTGVNNGAGGMLAVLSVADDVGPFEQVHSYALRYAQDRAAELVGMQYDEAGLLVPSDDAEMTITESTRDMIKQLVIKALSPSTGEPFNLKTALEELREEITGGYIFSRDRAALIAQSEIGMAHGQGALAQLVALEGAGLEVEKYWSTAKDDLVCSEICAENAAAGWLPVRDAFPSGHMAPLGHPRCRCVLTSRIKPTTKEN